MSQELFVSVNQLVEMARNKGTRYDHIVIESSGISEPKSVRSVFQDAESFEMKLLKEASRSIFLLHGAVVDWFIDWLVDCQSHNRPVRPWVLIPLVVD